MSRNYLRSYTLTIFSGTTADGVFPVKSISHLRIQFEVTKSVQGFPNTAKIVLFNTNTETRSMLQSKYTLITLSAGYAGSEKLIFKGQIRNLTQTREGVNSLLTVYAADGEQDWQNTFTNKTYAESVDIRTVIIDLMKSFPTLGIHTLEGLPTGADKLRGQTLSGSTKDILNMYAAEYGFVWSIQDGDIVTTKIGVPMQGGDTVLINAATGMVGTPTVTEIGADVTTLLNPLLLPNSMFKIESVNADFQLGNLYFREEVPRTSAEGFYKVLEVSFIGDSHDGSWLANTKGLAI